jgi:hypothetical protein
MEEGSFQSPVRVDSDFVRSGDPNVVIGALPLCLDHRGGRTVAHAPDLHVRMRAHGRTGFLGRQISLVVLSIPNRPADQGAGL